jgi:predicted ATPase/class 3 adenylate cyclase/Tfp pilus assembly protein PilF
MADLPAGTVAFLMTDVEGSTALWERDAASMEQALARHDRLAEQAVAAHNGTLVKSRGEGDSLFVVFAKATDALEAARALQEAYGVEAWPTPTPLRVRMAVHAGEVSTRSGDYYGPVVNRCARIREAAHGGQVLVSQTAHDLAAGALPSGVTLRNLGACRLRDLHRAEPLYQLCALGMGAEFPPLRSLDVIPNNLPLQLTNFIGREAQIAEVVERFAATRLLTITGIGGSGKTRLALQVAAEVMDSYPDGVWLVELAPLSDGSLIAQTIAKAVGAQDEGAGDPVATLVEYLKPQTCLLLLDNCEHLVPPCARIAARLLRSCPGVRILATGREALNVGGEQAWPVPSLSVPTASSPLPPTALQGYEAVRLFVDRARAVHPAFALTERNARAVSTLCQRLDGIPLALELAAARVKALSVEEIAARLNDRFKLLKTGDRTRLPRQQTLQATMDWSYELLTEEERVVFRRLGVFSGPWYLAAAEGICGADGTDEADVLDLLAGLVDRSLVVAEEGPAGTLYRLLETVREYALGRLREAGEEDAARLRHRDYYLALAEEAEPHLQQADQKLWLDRLEAEHANLRGALAWSVEPEAGMRLAAALWRFWYMRGYASEGRSWLEGTLARSVATSDLFRARALNGAGVLAMAQGAYDVATDHHTEALRIRTEVKDIRGMASSLNNLGLIGRHTGDYEGARKHYSQSLELYRHAGDRTNAALAATNLGVANMELGDYREADRLLREAADDNRACGNEWGLATALHNLGAVAERSGDAPLATRYYRESLKIEARIGDTAAIGLSLHTLAGTAFAAGDPQRAAILLGAADAILAATNTALPRSDDGSAYVVAAREALGPRDFEVAHNRGSTMPQEEAIEFALGDVVEECV